MLEPGGVRADQGLGGARFDEDQGAERGSRDPSGVEGVAGGPFGEVGGGESVVDGDGVDAEPAAGETFGIVEPGEFGEVREGRGLSGRCRPTALIATLGAVVRNVPSAPIWLPAFDASSTKH